jgi:signal transduction histidine kinase
MAVLVQRAEGEDRLGIFAGGLAHDFNNLLTGILGNATLLQQDIPPESPAQQSLRQIETAALRAAELVQQLLAYAGQGPLRLRPIDLSRLIHDMARLLRASVPPGTLLRLALAPNLPLIPGDPVQLRQLVTALLANAAEALPAGNGVITIRTEYLAGPQGQSTDLVPESAPEGGHAYLEVTDNGCGMDRRTLDRIFDPFFTTKFQGRGLGLAAVWGIVRAHQGLIRVASTPGQGSVFRVFLPCPHASLHPPSPAPE